MVRKKPREVRHRELLEGVAEPLLSLARERASDWARSKPHSPLLLQIAASLPGGHYLDLPLVGGHYLDFPLVGGHYLDFTLVGGHYLDFPLVDGPGGHYLELLDGGH